MFNKEKHPRAAIGGLRAWLPQIGLAAAFTLSAISSGTAWAETNCGVNTLRGSYLFATHGWNIVGGVAQPKAIVEGIDFNGDGTLTSPFAIVSVNGTILHFGAGTGVYTVNLDCTGTLTFSSGIAFEFFAETSGNNLWMIQTAGALPAVFEGTATRIH